MGGPGGAGGAGSFLDGDPAADEHDAGGGGGATGRIRISSVSSPSVLGTLSPIIVANGTSLGPIPTRPLP